jgi:hypothetical protein
MRSLVLIPGLLCDHRLWNSQIVGLSGSAEILIADITEQKTVSEMAAAVVEKAPDISPLRVSLSAAKWRLKSCAHPRTVSTG